jgi:hypothetical protein
VKLHAPFLMVIALVALLAILFSRRMTREMPDLEVYWQAAARARAAEPLYRAEDEHYQFKYLPAFAVLAIPLGLFTLGQAKALWFATSVGLAVALLALSLRLLPERRKPAWLLILLTIVAMGKFYGHELVLGQVNLLFAVLACAAVLAMERARETTAGLFVALAIVVKPYAVIFLPWLTALGRLQATAAATLGLLGALVLPVVVYGAHETVALHRAWWETVTTSTAPNLLNQDNVSIAAMFAKWLGPGSAAARLAAITGLALVSIAALVVVRRRGVRFPEGLEAGLLLTLVPLLSPQGWDYVFLVSTPAVMWLVNYEDRLPTPLRVITLATLALIGLSLIDVMGRANYARFMALSIITVCFFIVIALLATLRCRRIA